MGRGGAFYAAFAGFAADLGGRDEARGTTNRPPRGLHINKLSINPLQAPPNPHRMLTDSLFKWLCRRPNSNGPFPQKNRASQTREKASPKASTRYRLRADPLFPICPLILTASTPEQRAYHARATPPSEETHAPAPRKHALFQLAPCPTLRHACAPTRTDLHSNDTAPVYPWPITAHPSGINCYLLTSTYICYVLPPLTRAPSSTCRCRG